MHEDRGLVEERITRELSERVAPLTIRESVPAVVTAGPARDDQRPIHDGDAWGPPWGTTWFVITADLPPSWAGGHVEVEIDLGFRPTPPGFQCEGLIVDDDGEPVAGVHPLHRRHRVEAVGDPARVVVEAASNPSFPEFRPSRLGAPATAGDDPLYRFGGARFVLVDDDADALVHDLAVVDATMRALPVDDPQRTRLRAGLAAVLDLAPDVPAMRALVRPLLASRTGPAHHRIVATGHAHIDTAWLWPMRETVRKCTRTFASVVRLMDEYPEYRFACSQAQQYAWIEERHPALFERIRARVAEGRWVPVGGMWVETDANLPSGESLARQIVHGQRWFRDRFGVTCTEGWIPDVFGYPASLPQLLAAGGMHRFVTQKLSWNTSNRFPHHTFWWEGLDGTRVLTHFPPVDTYNAEITPGECVESARRFLDAAWSSWSLMPFGHGDGGGGPTREMLERARRLADLDGVPPVTIGAPASFFAEVEREARAGAPVPVWRGELYLETHRGTLTSQLETKLGNRRCERLLREVELWSATAGRPAGVDECWHEVLTQQFHDILPGSSIAWVHADATEVHARVAAELDRRRTALLDDLVPPSPHVANVSGIGRDELIEHDGRFVRVRVPAGAIVPLEPVPIEDRVVVSDGSMINGRLAVRWDDTGALTSVIDVRRARELIPEGERAAVLELAPDHPVRYDAWDVESWTPGLADPLLRPTAIEVLDRGPEIGRIRVSHRVGPSGFDVTYTLRAGSARLDVDVEVDWRHEEHLLSLAVPVDVRADTAACGIQFGHVRRPTHPSSPWDAAKFEVCTHGWIDVAEPSFGIAVLTPDRYGVGLFDGRIRVSLARAARYPDPDADRGRHLARFAILPHGPGLADVVAEAERFDQPLRVVDGTSGQPAPAPIVETIGGTIAIDAVKTADDGSGDLIVRCHEPIGDRTTVTVRCDRPLAAASRCDLLEEPLAAIDVCDGICVLTLRPFEIVTLRLERRPG